MTYEWTDAILARFEGREDLGKEGLYSKYFEPLSLDKSEAFACFEVIESGYGIPVGVMRPDDNLSKLTKRVETGNPLKWFLWLGKNEFSDDELIEELKIRLRKHGTAADWEKIESFEDLILAWCGKKPRVNGSQT